MSKEIDPNQSYTTTQVAEFTGLSNKQIARLIDAGQFPGAYLKSPVERSPRMVPGTAVISFLEKRNLTQQD